MCQQLHTYICITDSLTFISQLRCCDACMLYIRKLLLSVFRRSGSRNSQTIGLLLSWVYAFWFALSEVINYCRGAARHEPALEMSTECDNSQCANRKSSLSYSEKSSGSRIPLGNEPVGPGEHVPFVAFVHCRFKVSLLVLSGESIPLLLSIAESRSQQCQAIHRS